jgi:hypothetical protein
MNTLNNQTDYFKKESPVRKLYLGNDEKSLELQSKLESFKINVYGNYEYLQI